MAKVTLKFNGRFVQVVSSDKRKRSFLAPTFGQPFNGHETLMTIRHDELKFFEPEQGAGRTQLTTVDPAFRAATLSPKNDPFLVWDLAGRGVSFEVSGPPPTLEERGTESTSELGVMVGLDTLEKLKGRTAILKASALIPDPNGLTNAVIEVTTGKGKAKGRADDPAAFVINHGTPTAEFAKNPDGTRFELVPAEVIEFEIDLPSGKEFMTFTLAGPSSSGTVTVRKGATVVFTNLCAQLGEHGELDVEFGQYYKLLEPPSETTGFLPIDVKAAASLTESAPCWMPASIAQTAEA